MNLLLIMQDQRAPYILNAVHQFAGNQKLCLAVGVDMMIKQDRTRQVAPTPE
jgi:hypothetical protein